MPTQDQVMGLLRQLLPLLGGIAVGLGWLTKDEVAGYSALILQSVGPIMIIIGWVLSMIANSKTSILKSAAAMPETRVVANGATTTITIHDPDLAQAAAESATPLHQ